MTVTTNTKMHVHREMVHWCCFKLISDIKNGSLGNFTKEEKQHITAWGEMKQSHGQLSLSVYFYKNLNFESVKGILIRLMYSVANGACSFKDWAESRHNDSHSFPLKGQLSQIEALLKEPNLVK